MKNIQMADNLCEPADDVKYKTDVKYNLYPAFMNEFLNVWNWSTAMDKKGQI